MHKILVIDDERKARNFIAELVAFYIPDAEVTQAESAYKALDYLRTENYDLLFVDITMPGMTGLELLETISRTGKQPFVFIITAYREYDYAVKGFRLGILDYIEKPLHPEKIYKATKLYLSKIKTHSIDLKVFDGVRRVAISDLLAIEAVDRGKVKVYTTDSLFPEVTGTLAQLHSRLPSNFCYIRRDCIVNLYEVKHYNSKMQSLEVAIVCQNREEKLKASRKGMRDLLARFDSLTVPNDET